MENNSFRCHFSIVFENLGSTFFTICALLILNLDNMGEMIKEFLAGNVKALDILFVFGILFGILLLVFIIQVVIWSKTWISVEGDAIVIEKRTLNRKKNTIGMKNISNINMEQNIFERIVGTCKVKLDTNSQSTAETTDVKIVLKKDKAEAFRKQVMDHMNADIQAEEINEEEDYDVSYTLKDIVMHCIYTASIFNVLVLAAFLIGAIIGIRSISIGDVLLNGIINVLGSLLALLIVLFSVVRSLIKDFFVYYGFRAKRKADKIYLSYGLLKKRHYVLSVDKINAIRVVAPAISRVFGRQYVELVCIGIGDEQNEKSILLLSEKRQDMLGKLSVLLPEISLEDRQMLRRKKNTVWHEITGILFMFVFLSAIVVFAGILNVFGISGLWGRILISAVAVLVFVYWLVYVYMTFRTEGVYVGNDILIVSSGAFSKRVVWIPYQRIQTLQYSQGPVARHFGYARGIIHILANVANSIHGISCFDITVFNQIQQHMLMRNGNQQVK